MPKLQSFALSFFIVVLSVYILIIARGFFLPLVVALVIAYLIITIADGIEKISIGGWHVPRFIAFLLTITLFFVAIVLVATMIGNNVAQLVAAAPTYQEKLNNLLTQTYNLLGIKPKIDIPKMFEDFDFVSFITQIARMLTDIASYAGLISIYVIFLLVESQHIDSKINALFNKEAGRTSTREIMSKITYQIKSYIRIKTFLSILTASLSYLVLISVGVDFPDFWAFLIFLLNFIPTIGSIIATIFPCLLTLVQFDTIAPFIIVTIGLISIQMLVGNFLEPRIMGSSFNLSSLVIILSLSMWGAIWGIMGMFLCVPIIVITSIILSNFKQTRPIAVMLSQNGEIK